MRLKKYNEFQSINEHFGGSKEYSDFLNDKSLDREYFMDNLMSISDIEGITVSLNKSVLNDEGRFIEQIDGKEYYIKYMVGINYMLPTKDYDKVDDFFEKIEVFNEVKLAIDELKDRVSDKVKLHWEKVILDPSEAHRARNIENFGFRFSIHFISEDISNEVRPYYDKYKSSMGPNYEKMLDKLRAFYKTYDIDFDKYYDTNNTGDNLNIGIFPPGDADLHHVADYEFKTDKFDIYHQALRDSLRDFRRPRPYVGDP